MQQNYGFNKSFSMAALDLEQVHPIGYCLYSLLILMEIEIYQQVKQNQTFSGCWFNYIHNMFYSPKEYSISIETEGKRSTVSIHVYTCLRALLAG